jgi:hypothetical protein
VSDFELVFGYSNRAAAINAAFINRAQTPAAPVAV